MRASKPLRLRGRRNRTLYAQRVAALEVLTRLTTTIELLAEVQKIQNRTVDRILKERQDEIDSRSLMEEKP